MRALKLILVVLVATAQPREVRAWGPRGHRVAGRVAEARLTPKAKAAVKALLEPGESLADASTWADDFRDQVPGSTPWHFVNVPITEERYHARYCDDRRGCVVDKIREFRKTVVDKTQPIKKRREALRFLVHLIEDLHMPLHVGTREERGRSDRGGNNLQVQFFRRGMSLHRVWDTGLIEEHSRDENRWLREVNAEATSENARAWSKGTLEDWATESLEAARKAYENPETLRPIREGDRLEREYLDQHLPVVRKRLAQAGTRLASVLNGLFP